MNKKIVALSLVASLTLASCAPMPQTRNTARELGQSQSLTIADEKPGSNNGSTNSSCCSSDPRGSSNSSSNKSVNLDDFRENGKAGPTVDQLLAQQNAQRGQAQQQQAVQRAAQQQTRRVTTPARRAGNGRRQGNGRRRTNNTRRRVTIRRSRG